MNILLISLEEDVSFVKKTIKNIDLIKDTFIWNDSNGPYELYNISFDDYDYIILAVKKQYRQNSIYRFLIYEYSVNKDKILCFYDFYRCSVPFMRADRRMQYPLIDQYKCLIFGISHAATGIIPHILKYPSANLAIASQDIYYNLKTLEYCYKEYKNKIQSTEYIIFDMFNYTYFNFDTSMSRNAQRYYEWGGYNLDPHNFEKNKFDISFNDCVYNAKLKFYNSITTDNFKIMLDLFGDLHKYNNYSLMYNYENIYKRTHIITGNEEDGTLNTYILRKTFPDTIKENIDYLHKFLDLCYHINSKMKVILLIMPRYYEEEERIRPIYNKWKEVFYKIINDLKSIYPFTVLDLKNHDISKNKLYFDDFSHFNYLGAVKFTNIINSYL